MTAYKKQGYMLRFILGALEKIDIFTLVFFLRNNINILWHLKVCKLFRISLHMT